MKYARHYWETVRVHLCSDFLLQFSCNTETGVNIIHCYWVKTSTQYCEWIGQVIAEFGWLCRQIATEHVFTNGKTAANCIRKIRNFSCATVHTTYWAFVFFLIRWRVQHWDKMCPYCKCYHVIWRHLRETYVWSVQCHIVGYFADLHILRQVCASYSSSVIVVWFHLPILSCCVYCSLLTWKVLDEFD